ncbi:hypothetical protein H9651_04510 [Microbacterium sp. Sa4CUA7]|uniref:Uncharacterized protein n=1 Tax=Microbacterium pullorum TaxID=2762236 RepID=A0ABR8S090_9MICO|nr:hypothetical protein [Microbacterium pullorum]MBD7956888.1 hypothetical protein [Microbacterium pullorum]
MSDLSDAVGEAVLRDAGIDGGAPLGVPEHLALIAASSRAEAEVRTILQRSVGAARAGGASWALIGAELGMSRQAAQQRFGAVVETSPAAEATQERWLGPVTAFDEMAELEAAGRAGWRTIEVGMLAHRMRRTATQWEHRRIFWRTSLAAEEREGWEVGCRAFPWIYLVRDRGIPAERR